jgi:hypothetical protein
MSSAALHTHFRRIVIPDSAVLLSLTERLFEAENGGVSKDRRIIPFPTPAKPTAKRNRRPAIFTVADVTRAVKGFIRAGLQVIGGEITPDGKIKVICAGTDDEKPENKNEWDEVYK